MSESVLSFESVTTRFGAAAVHEGVSFAVGRGEIVALIGASGTGKSMLVKEAIGLVRPASGRIELLGTDVCRAGSPEMNALRRRFGMLFQDGALFSSLTVAENVAVPFHEHTDLPDALIAPLVGFKLSLVGLAADAGAKRHHRWPAVLVSADSICHSCALHISLHQEKRPLRTPCLGNC